MFLLHELLKYFTFENAVKRFEKVTDVLALLNVLQVRTSHIFFASQPASPICISQPASHSRVENETIKQDFGGRFKRNMVVRLLYESHVCGVYG